MVETLSDIRGSLSQSIYWAVVFLIAAITRWYSFARHRLHFRVQAISSILGSRKGALFNYIPSLHGPDLETVAIYAYWVFVTLLSCVSYYIENDSL